MLCVNVGEECLTVVRVLFSFLAEKFRLHAAALHVILFGFTCLFVSSSLVHSYEFRASLLCWLVSLGHLSPGFRYIFRCGFWMILSMWAYPHPWSFKFSCVTYDDSLFVGISATLVSDIIQFHITLPLGTHLLLSKKFVIAPLGTIWSIGWVDLA